MSCGGVFFGNGSSCGSVSTGCSGLRKRIIIGCGGGNSLGCGGMREARRAIREAEEREAVRREREILHQGRFPDEREVNVNLRMSTNSCGGGSGGCGGGCGGNRSDCNFRDRFEQRRRYY